MDHASVRAFVTVAREGNLTRAADRLCLTQPALSLQIKKLQSMLDLVLFERYSRGMRLTDAGRKLLPAAERALAAADEFGAAAAGLKGPLLGTLKIGTILDTEFLRLGTFLDVLANRYPGLAFELRHGMSGAVLQEVELGHLDVAYTLGLPGFPDMHERFHVEPLATFTYRVIAPSGWSTQVRGKGWNELAALPWIGTPAESIHSRLLKRIFSAAGVEQNVVARVDLEPTMLDLVKSGVALSLARESLALRAAHSDGITIVEGVSVEAELGFLCCKDRRLELPVAAALLAVRESWGNQPS